MRVLYFFLAFGLLITSSVSAIEPKYEAYSEILEKYVIEGKKHGIKASLVQYHKLKNNPLLEQAKNEVSNFDISLLSNRQEKIAFYVNAYNIFTLSLIATNWPVKSIKDLGKWYSPIWDKKLFTLNYKKVSLDDIEHNILRELNEPRIHFTLCCAAISCPDLRNEPYISDMLNKQFDEQVVIYLNNSTKGLRVERKSINISKIFSWYEDDFRSDGGVLSFISKNSSKKNISNKPVEYLKYDWSLNDSALFEYSKSK